MTFDDILEHAIAMLQRRGRATYRTLKRQLHLDDEALEDLKFELIEGQRLATDENGTVLMWTGTFESAQAIADAPAQAIHQPATQEPHSPSVAPQPTAPHTPEAERRQLTVMFCDLCTGNSNAILPMITVASAGAYLLSTRMELGPRHHDFR